MIDLSTVPLNALSEETKDIISTLLNPTKFIPTDDGLPRDWRGLAHLSGTSGESLPNLACKPDPCAFILKRMQEKAQDFTLSKLFTLLETLDRWDVIDDTRVFIEKDADTYVERSTRSNGEIEKIDADIDKDILTVDDLHRLNKGLEFQNYDAFLLFADEDADFASEIVENLEKKSDLTLCLKDRDLIGGLTFEHDAVRRLIAERCNRLIVVVSPNFLKSPANKFFLNFAQALGIDKRQRKVIPCLYQRCQLPSELSYYFILDYNRAGKLFDFWARLRDSVRGAASTNRTIATQPPIQQLPEPTISELPVTIDTTERQIEQDRSEIPGPVEETPIKKKSRKNWLKRNQNAKTEVAQAQESENLSPLPSTVRTSTLSLPDVHERKKNFMDKCVIKVRSLMKS